MILHIKGSEIVAICHLELKTFDVEYSVPPSKLDSRTEDFRRQPHTGVVIPWLNIDDESLIAFQHLSKRSMIYVLDARTYSCFDV
jgi:hypothetical protein